MTQCIARTANGHGQCLNRASVGPYCGTHDPERKVRGFYPYKHPHPGCEQPEPAPPPSERRVQEPQPEETPA